jgi:hypothetical protein
MLINCPRLDPPKFAVLPDNRESEFACMAVLAALRRSKIGARSDLRPFSGKTFDRAVKAGVPYIVLVDSSPNVTGGYANIRLKRYGGTPRQAMLARRRLIRALQSHFSLQPFLMHGDEENTMEWIIYKRAATA